MKSFSRQFIWIFRYFRWKTFYVKHFKSCMRASFILYFCYSGWHTQNDNFFLERKHLHSWCGKPIIIISQFKFIHCWNADIEMRNVYRVILILYTYIILHIHTHSAYYTHYPVKRWKLLWYFRCKIKSLKRLTACFKWVSF